MPTSKLPLNSTINCAIPWSASPPPSAPPGTTRPSTASSRVFADPCTCTPNPATALQEPSFARMAFRFATMSAMSWPQPSCRGRRAEEMVNTSASSKLPAASLTVEQAESKADRRALNEAAISTSSAPAAPSDRTAESHALTCNEHEPMALTTAAELPVVPVEARVQRPKVASKGRAKVYGRILEDCRLIRLYVKGVDFLLQW